MFSALSLNPNLSRKSYGAREEASFKDGSHIRVTISSAARARRVSPRRKHEPSNSSKKIERLSSPQFYTSLQIVKESSMSSRGMTFLMDIRLLPSVHCERNSGIDRPHAFKYRRA